MSIFPSYFPVLKKTGFQAVIRGDYLNQIKELFQKNQIIIVHGYGGFGKTTLALEYCNFASKETNIRWFDSYSHQVLETEYRKLSALLDINEVDEDLDFVIENTNIKLKQIDKEILFVFDNVESFDEINKFINKLPKNIKVLITTRHELKTVEYPKIELKPFEINEARQFINIENKKLRYYFFFTFEFKTIYFIKLKIIL